MYTGADLGILRGGGGVRAQVRRNFHILTSKKKRNLGGGGPNPATGTGSATGTCSGVWNNDFIRCITYVLRYTVCYTDYPLKVL